MTRNDFEARIRAEIQRCMKIASDRWPHLDFPFPNIKWNNRSTATTAGTARGSTWTLTFATQMLMANPDKIEDTAAHEYAHLVDYRTNGNSPRTKRKGNRLVRDAHGPHFKSVMRLFGRSTARCHTMKPVKRKTVRRYEYKCKCRTYQLGPKRHRNIQSGTRRYHCRSCKTALTPATLSGTVVGNRVDGFTKASSPERPKLNPRPKMPKPGTKQERAIQILRGLGAGVERKFAIYVLMNELDMSAAGAQTYYYKAKKVLGI